MKILTVRCNECGAPLDVSESARYLTCTHCGTQLAVQRTESSIFTEKLDAITEKTEEIAGNLGVIRIQNEIAQLDREWEMERQSYLVRGKDGHMHEPGTASSLVGGVLGAAGFLVFSLIAGGAGAPGGFVAIAVVLAVVMLISGISSANRGSRMAAARDTYQQKREALKAALAASGK